MRKRLFLLLGGLWAATLSLAGQALPSLLVSVDAAALGRAETTLAAEPGAFSARDHAAAMVFSPATFSAGVSYALWQPRAGADQIGAFSSLWRPGQRLAVGLSGLWMGMPTYEVTSPNGTVSQVNGTFSPRELVATLSGAYMILEGLSMGLSAHICSSSLAADAKASALGADISASYVREAFRAGFSVQNIGGKASYDEETAAAQPLRVRAGAGYRFAGCVSLLGEAAWMPVYGLSGAAGAECDWHQTLFARAGAHFGAHTPLYGTLGLGARFSGLSLDAAWVFAGETLGNTLLFTLGYGF